MVRLVGPVVMALFRAVMPQQEFHGSLPGNGLHTRPQEREMIPTEK